MSLDALLRKNRLRNSNLGIDTQRELQFEARKEKQFPGSRAKAASTMFGLASLPFGGGLARAAPKIAPYLNIFSKSQKSAPLQTALTASWLPEVAEDLESGTTNLRKGNYPGALRDYSVGVGSLFMAPWAVRQAGQAARYINRPAGRKIFNVGKNLGKYGTKEGFGTKTKGATILSGFLAGEMLEDPAFAEDEIQPITTTKPKTKEKIEDSKEFTDALTGQGVLEDLIPDTEDQIMGGHEGPSGPLGGPLGKKREDDTGKTNLTNIDQIMGGTEGPSGPLGGLLGENIEDDINKVADDKLFANKLTTSYLYNKMQSGPPSTFNAIKNRIEKSYQDSDAKIQELRSLLSKEKVKTFDEYRGEFNKMSGHDGGQKMMDYIMLQMGFDLLSGKSYESGLSGFLDIFGQAGGAAAEKGMAVLRSEQELNQGLALKFQDYEEKFNKYLTDQEKEIINAELMNLQGRDSLEIDAMNARHDAEFQIDKLWFEALSRDDAAKGGPDLEGGEPFNIQISDPNAFGGIQNYAAQRQKGTGKVFVRINNVFVPYENLKLSFNFTETKIDQVGSRKAQAQANYAHAGVNIVDNVIRLATDLPLGSTAYITDIISQGVGWEDLSRNLFSFGADDSGTLVDNPYRKHLDKFNTEDNETGGFNVGKFLVANTIREDGTIDTEERKALMDQYDAEKKDIMDNFGKAGHTYTIKDEKGNKKIIKSKGIVERMYANHYKGPEVDKNGVKIPEAVKIEKVRQALAAYKVYENKLKYILANSNKAEDRLTRADVADAEDQVRIFEFKDSKVILNKYKIVRQMLNTTFENKVETMRRNGFRDDEYFLNKYSNMNLVRNHLNKQKKIEQEKKNQSLYTEPNQEAVLRTM